MICIGLYMPAQMDESDAYIYLNAPCMLLILAYLHGLNQSIIYIVRACNFPMMTFSV